MFHPLSFLSDQFLWWHKPNPHSSNFLPSFARKEIKKSLWDVLTLRLFQNNMNDYKRRILLKIYRIWRVGLIEWSNINECLWTNKCTNFLRFFKYYFIFSTWTDFMHCITFFYGCKIAGICGTFGMDIVSWFFGLLSVSVSSCSAVGVKELILQLMPRREDSHNTLLVHLSNKTDWKSWYYLFLLPDGSKEEVQFLETLTLIY